MKLKVNQEKGITLIALIVTIIVLLILSAITIAMLTGQNGILNRAAESKKTTVSTTLDEQVKLGVMEARVNGLGTIASTTSLDSALKNNVGDGNYTLEETDTGWKIIAGEKTYTLNKDGDMTIEQEEVSNKKAVSVGFLNSDDAKIDYKYFYFAGMNYKFDASVTYDDGSKDSNVVWSVDNPEVATIDDNGNLTVLKNGNIKITAASKKDATINKSMNITTYGENGIYGNANSGGSYNNISNSFFEIHTNEGVIQEIVIPTSVLGDTMTLAHEDTDPIELKNNGDYFMAFNNANVEYCYVGAGGMWVGMTFTPSPEEQMNGGMGRRSVVLKGMNKTGFETISIEVAIE